MSREKLVQAISDLREPEALQVARELLDQGLDPLLILEDCKRAMNIIGDRFEQETAFLPELMMAGEILKSISEQLKPKLGSNNPPDCKGKIIIGTVQGDIHDIAKDIVVFMLEINGFDVYDLGVDVPPQKFIEKVQQEEASILALSGFLTLAYDPMKATIQELDEAGLRNHVRVMIGGGQVDDYACQYVDADAWGPDAMSAVRLAEEWTNNVASQR